MSQKNTNSSETNSTMKTLERKIKQENLMDKTPTAAPNTNLLQLQDSTDLSNKENARSGQNQSSESVSLNLLAEAESLDTDAIYEDETKIIEISPSSFDSINYLSCSLCGGQNKLKFKNNLKLIQPESSSSNNNLCSTTSPSISNLNHCDLSNSNLKNQIQSNIIKQEEIVNNNNNQVISSTSNSNILNSSIIKGYDVD